MCRSWRLPRRRSFRSVAAEILLSLAALLWIAVVVVNHERVEVPRMFWPLAAYAGATLVASFFSVDPEISFIDCKQLVLFAIVPITYRLFRGERSLTVIDVVITVGALNAVYGIVQFGILDFDNVGQRVQGNLGTYMTYSGVSHARRLRRGGARDVPAARADLGRARPPRACSSRSS